MIHPLKSMAEQLREEIRSSVAGRDSQRKPSAVTYLLYGKVTSTMDVAKELIGGGNSSVSPHAVIDSAKTLATERVQNDAPFLYCDTTTYAVVAQSQDFGKGRNGRSWISRGEGIYVTYILPLNIDSTNLTGFSLVVGLALQDALVRCGVSTNLKWPNDLLCKDPKSGQLKKIAGILVDTISRGTKVSSALIGIGINLLNNAGLEEVGGISLEQVTKNSVAKERLIIRLSESLDYYNCKFKEQTFSSFKSEWEHKSGLTGASARLVESSVFTGGTEIVLLGVSDAGALRFRIGKESYVDASARIELMDGKL